MTNSERQSLRDLQKAHRPYRSYKSSRTSDKKHVITGHRANGTYQSPTASLRQHTFQRGITARERELEQAANAILRQGVKLHRKLKQL